MPFCSKCGFQAGEVAMFCPRCGTSLAFSAFASGAVGQRTQHSWRYVRVRQSMMIFLVLGLSLIAVRSLPISIAFFMGSPPAAEDVLNVVMLDVTYATITAAGMIWWLKHKTILDQPEGKRAPPKAIDIVLMTLGSFLVGAVFGILAYDSVWGLNNTFFVPSRDLRIQGPFGTVYMLVFAAGAVFLLIGFLNVSLRRNAKI